MSTTTDLAALVAASRTRARRLAAEPVIRRSATLADIPPERLDSRATERLGARRETFALAMCDFFDASRIAAVIPEVALAAAELGDSSLAERARAQLEEAAGWSPLQRPGWTLYRPGEPPAPGYRDGSWLATGVAMWAITEAARALAQGGSPLPRGLDERLRALVRREIAEVFGDWREQVPWFTKGNGSPACNQWVLPLCAIVEGAAWLGTRSGEHAGPYEMAVANLNRSLDTQGPDGDFVEGFSYALFTMTHWLRAARAALRAGDGRLAAHPYLRAFPGWMAQMLLPGGWVLNVCDCGITRVPTELENDRRLDIAELPSLAVLATRSPQASWLLGQYLGPSCTAAGLEAARELPDPAPPPRWGAMRSLGVVTWRTGWGPSDHAVWIRTSGGLRSHTHADSAHVSLFRNGRPVLIEAGTPTYGHPDIGRSFGSGAGHNVLQVGLEWPEAYMEERAIPGWLARDTPVTVAGSRLGEDGGEVVLDVAPSGYGGLRSWRRVASWDREALLRVADTVELASPQPILFRWHIAGGEPLRIEGSGGPTVVARRGGTAVRLRADRPIAADDVPWPGPDEVVGPHRCLTVRTAAPEAGLSLITDVS